MGKIGAPHNLFVCDMSNKLNQKLILVNLKALIFFGAIFILF